jgi:hypothetical protein
MPAGTGYSVAQVVDIRGVGKGDLVWLNTNGAAGLWIMDWAAPVNGAFAAATRYSVFPAGSAWAPAVGLEANR